MRLSHGIPTMLLDFGRGIGALQLVAEMLQLKMRQVQVKRLGRALKAWPQRLQARL